jgi:hypothetical protein
MDLNEKFAADERRAKTQFPPELLRQVLAARREKIANKTRELERERRGEITNRAVKRKRKMLPGPLMTTRSPASRRHDHVSRSLSEVGYVGMIRERLGHGMKTGTWRLYEEGLEENRKKLGLDAKMIERENRRRRSASEEREVTE